MLYIQVRSHYERQDLWHIRGIRHKQWSQTTCRNIYQLAVLPQMEGDCKYVP